MRNDTVRDRLRTILLRIAEAEHVRQWRVCRYQRIYAYGKDGLGILAAAASSIGFVGPGSDLLRQTVSEGGPSAVTPTYDVTVIERLSDPLFITGLLLFVGWFAYKTFITHEGIEKRTVLALNARKQLINGIEKIRPILETDLPMPDLTAYYSNVVGPVYDQSRQEDAWPDYDHSTMTRIKAQVEQQLEELCNLYEAAWAPPPQTDRRPEKANEQSTASAAS